MRTADLPSQLTNWQERRWLDSQQLHSERHATRLLSTCACTVASYYELNLQHWWSEGVQLSLSCWHHYVKLLWNSIDLCFASHMDCCTCSYLQHSMFLWFSHDWHMHKMPPQIILDILSLELLMQWQIMNANWLFSHVSYAHLAKFIRPSVGSWMSHYVYSICMYRRLYSMLDKQYSPCHPYTSL